MAGAPANRRIPAPGIILPNDDRGATLALWRAIFVARLPCQTRPAGIEIFGVALLAVALVAIAAVITAALLAYFAACLCFVGVLLAGTIVADLGHQWWYRSQLKDAPLEFRRLASR